MRIKHKKTFEVQSLIISFLVIAFCEAFFLLDVAADILQLDISTSWIDHSLIELITAFSLAPALVIIGLRIKRLLQDHREAQSFVKVASGELLTVIFEKFAEWQFTPSENEIALFLIKGLSVQEIAELRNTRPGTVKSQSSTIYHKAGVKGRNELVAYFVEDLLAGNDDAN
ncbi:MAG: helix-turn-helix transcriptional regulator [Rhodospirillales bacterium]|jgi:DNA-binding CsgD family transcriptional regulator|nr:helix-turn-helix transcriptional regulator [Rhodospirillales bacterium]